MPVHSGLQRLLLSLTPIVQYVVGAECCGGTYFRWSESALRLALMLRMLTIFRRDCTDQRVGRADCGAERRSRRDGEGQYPRCCWRGKPGGTRSEVALKAYIRALPALTMEQQYGCLQAHKYIAEWMSCNCLILPLHARLQPAFAVDKLLSSHCLILGNTTRFLC